MFNNSYRAYSFAKIQQRYRLLTLSAIFFTFVILPMLLSDLL